MLYIVDFRPFLTAMLSIMASIGAYLSPSLIRSYDTLLPLIDGNGPVDAHKDEINAHLAAQQPAGRPDRQAELVKTLDDLAALVDSEIAKLPAAPPEGLLKPDDWPGSVGTALCQRLRYTMIAPDIALSCPPHPQLITLPHAHTQARPPHHRR